MATLPSTRRCSNTPNSSCASRAARRIAQLYAFQQRGRELALRPEFTASVARYYVEHAQAEPLPARYRYCGPVFRYENPQAGRSRQFTEFGCELLGASGALADVEIIALALDGLRLAGVQRPRLVLGHIGVVIDFLAGLAIDQRAQDWLTWSMERCARATPARTNCHTTCWAARMCSLPSRRCRTRS